MATVGIVGLGAIGSAVADHLIKGAVPGVELRAVVSRHPVHHAAFRWLPRWQDVVPLVDIVVECASQAVARELVIPALEAGKVVIPASVGAFADEAFYRHALGAAGRRAGRLVVPAGSIGGMDLLTALTVGDLKRVRLTTRKSPRSLGLSHIAGPVEVFRGSAREAAHRYPQNLNVAMTLSLHGLGPDRTEVVLVADPSVTANTHTVYCQADAGTYELTFANVPDPVNPKTSLLASYSIVACLRPFSSDCK